MAGRKGSKKFSKASKQASKALKGRDTTPEQDISFAVAEEQQRTKESWLNKPVMKGMRITWRAVILFLLCCLILDVILYLIVQVGFGSCYGLLCLIG